jgi:Na+-transporting methylmalonyl-CoA/oxaloacetate decarboxylase gamma subunit
MNKIVTLSLLVLLMSFSGNVVAHCGDAEAHAASSQEHIEKDNTNEGNEKKRKNHIKII